MFGDNNKKSKIMLTTTGIASEQLTDLTVQLKNLCGSNLACLLIYGSRSNGEWIGASDLDLLIVLDMAEPTKAREKPFFQIINDWEDRIKVETNFTVLTKAELFRPSSLALEVANKHYILWDNGTIANLQWAVNQLISENIVNKQGNSWRIFDEETACSRLYNASKIQTSKLDQLLQSSRLR